MSGLVEINKIIVWAVSMEFIDLATLLNGEQSLPDFLNKCMIKDGNMIAERENQIKIQTGRMEEDNTAVDKADRKLKIDILQTQKQGIETRLKFYSETLQEIKK